MGLNAFTQTADRMRVVHYSQAFMFSEYYMIMRRPPATDRFFVIYPFKRFTWLGLIAIMAGKYVTLFNMPNPPKYVLNNNIVDSTQYCFIIHYASIVFGQPTGNKCAQRFRMPFSETAAMDFGWKYSEACIITRFGRASFLSSIKLPSLAAKLSFATHLCKINLHSVI